MRRLIGHEAKVAAPDCGAMTRPRAFKRAAPWNRGLGDQGAGWLRAGGQAEAVERAVGHRALTGSVNPHRRAVRSMHGMPYGSSSMRTTQADAQTRPASRR